VKGQLKMNELSLNLIKHIENNKNGNKSVRKGQFTNDYNKQSRLKVTNASSVVNRNKSFFPL
jgi:hypothetical protein